MSDIMLHAVLNMPADLWSNDVFDKMQRHSRYTEASKRIEDLNKAMQLLVNSNNNWPLSLTDDQVDFINNLLLLAENQ